MVMVRLNIAVEIHLQKENRHIALIYLILKLQYCSLRKQWLLIAPNSRVSISRNVQAVPGSEEDKAAVFVVYGITLEDICRLGIF